MLKCNCEFNIYLSEQLSIADSHVTHPLRYCDSIDGQLIWEYRDKSIIENGLDLTEAISTKEYRQILYF